MSWIDFFLLMFLPEHLINMIKITNISLFNGSTAKGQTLKLFDVTILGKTFRYATVDIC